MVDADQQQQRHQQDLLIGTYFLELWRQNSRASMTLDAQRNGENEEMEDDPTELDTINSSGGFSVVFPDKLTVQYPSVNLHGHDVGVVQANKPAPVRRLVYYFEVFVKNAGAKGQIGIGFTAEGFKMRRQPGYNHPSPRSHVTLKSHAEVFVGGEADLVPWKGKFLVLSPGGPLENDGASEVAFAWCLLILKYPWRYAPWVLVGYALSLLELFRCCRVLLFSAMPRSLIGFLRCWPQWRAKFIGEQLLYVPCWEANSYGYHGDDGLLYRGHGKGEEFGPTFTAGDTVGGGINYASQEFFFTKNGAVVGTVYKDVKGRLFPTIAVHSQNEEFKLAKDDALVDFEIDEDLCAAWWSFLKRCLVGRVEDVSVLAPSCIEIGNLLVALSEQTIIPWLGTIRRSHEVAGIGPAFSGVFGPQLASGPPSSNQSSSHRLDPEVSLLSSDLLAEERFKIVFLRVSVNFGEEPFIFDLKAFEAQERAKQQMTVEKVSIPQSASHGIVRSYLLYYGYEDTLSLFDTATLSTVPPISLAQENGISEHDNMYDLKRRKILRQLIRCGEIDDAVSKLRDWYPQIFEEHTSATCFLLHCQKFIELVRVGKLEEAVVYGRTEFEKFYRLAEYDDLVKECAALLAYEQPQKSSVGYLLEDSQREIVADAINAIILSTNPNMKGAQDCLHSYLERLLRQLTACFLERRSLNGDQGEAFHLGRIFNSSKKG
ncbi:hypothetical protein RJ639_016534 [Escallonia herrerae]|uniref:Uncharacterized protein n=1 Tax=Escallonia herrerae TaxID=1293975 RepID=A0AA89AKV2_9ASTE|nr:hypothetical protein RJ639_016534 [Escallonia herrerae]